MPITIDFSPADVQNIQRIADIKQLSITEYIHSLTLNAVREEEELAETDRRLEQVRQGRVVYKTMEELEEMAK